MGCGSKGKGSARRRGHGGKGGRRGKATAMRYARRRVPGGGADWPVPAAAPGPDAPAGRRVVPRSRGSAISTSTSVSTSIYYTYTSMDICICLDTVYHEMGLRHRSLLSLIVLQTLHRFVRPF